MRAHFWPEFINFYLLLFNKATSIFFFKLRVTKKNSSIILLSECVIDDAFDVSCPSFP